MDLLSLDHVHFAVPDLERAQAVFAPWLRGTFTPIYGGPEMNAWGVWNSNGGDFIQVIDPGKLAFGSSSIQGEGILSVSFRVSDVDEGIAQAQAAGLELRSRVGSEDIGMGKNVVQAQFHPAGSFGLGLELVERQIPGDPHEPLNRSAVDYIEHTVEDLDAPMAFLGEFFGSPFEPVVHDEALAARSARHARFGIQLSAPSGPGITRERLEARGPGLHAIAFQSDDLERDIATAEALKLARVRTHESSDGVREAEFAPEAGVILKLVQRGGQSGANA